MEGIYFLKAVSPGTVFTDSSRGIWMNYAGKENIIDENYLFAPDVEERYNDINKVYLSRNFDEIKGILDKYSVDYIWIDQEMKENIWESDSQGLLFILYYTKTFNKIYDKNGVEIWEVKK